MKPTTSRTRVRTASLIGIAALLAACTERPATAPDVRIAKEVATYVPTTSDINAAGGALENGSDGLRLWTSYGRYQIRRNNVNQIYSQSDAPASLSFGLWTVDGLFATNAPDGYWWSILRPAGAVTSWVQTSNLLTPVGLDTWRNEETLTGTKNGRTYTLKITTEYTTPNGFADVTAEVTLPDGVTAAPQLYLASDFQLNGSDRGAGATGTVNGRRYVVQVGSGVVGGLLEGGVSTDPGFTSYVEDFFPCTFGGAGAIQFSLPCNGVVPTSVFGPATGGPYTNSVNADPATDAGVGAHWDLNTTAAGTVTRKVKLYFDVNLPGFTPDRPLTITANNKSIAFLTDAPADDFYTYTVTDASGAIVTPTFTTAPACTSRYFVPAEELSFPITCSGAASAGDTYTYVAGTLSVTPAPLSVTYTGASGVLTPLPATLSLSATLAPDICAFVGTVTYAIAPDPTTGTGTRTITNGVSTTGWLPGVYAITATYAGNPYCGAASDVGVLTVANPGTTGDATTGGGQYVGSTSTQSDLRVNFGHTVQTTAQLDRKTGNTTRTYRGNLLWMVTSGWRLNGAVASTTVRSSAGALVSGPTEAFITTPCPAGVGTSSSKPKCGEFTGTGVLQQYDPVAKNWKTATQFGTNGTVSFKATIYDGGSVSTCKTKTTCTITDYADSFGLTMTGVSKTNGVPVGSPTVLLKSQNGSIKIR